MGFTQAKAVTSLDHISSKSLLHWGSSLLNSTWIIQHPYEVSDVHIFNINRAWMTLGHGVAVLHKLHRSSQSCTALQENGKKQWQNLSFNVLGKTVSSRYWEKYSTLLVRLIEIRIDISSNETKLNPWKRSFTENKAFFECFPLKATTGWFDILIFVSLFKHQSWCLKKNTNINQ